MSASAPDLDLAPVSEAAPAGEEALEEARAELVIARLIAYSRLLREAAEQGTADRIDELLDKRQTLIASLGAPEAPIPEAVRARLDELATEDARTVAALTEWRDRTRQDLLNLPELKSAVAGYARPAGPKRNLFEREL